MKIVYKTKDGLIVSWKDVLVDENVYQLKENEMFGDRFDPPRKLAIVDGVVVNTWSQEDQDAADAEALKEANRQAYRDMEYCVWVGPTPDGTQDWAVLLGNDGKLSTVQVN